MNFCMGTHMLYYLGSSPFQKGSGNGTSAVHKYHLLVSISLSMYVFIIIHCSSSINFFTQKDALIFAS